jgi:hypothetical protein
VFVSHTDITLFSHHFVLLLDLVVGPTIIFLQIDQLVLVYLYGIKLMAMKSTTLLPHSFFSESQATQIKTCQTNCMSALLLLVLIFGIGIFLRFLCSSLLLLVLVVLSTTSTSYYYSLLVVVSSFSVFWQKK